VDDNGARSSTSSDGSSYDESADATNDGLNDMEDDEASSSEDSMASDGTSVVSTVKRGKEEQEVPEHKDGFFRNLALVAGDRKGEADGNEKRQHHRGRPSASSSGQSSSASSKKRKAIAAAYSESNMQNSLGYLP